MESIGTENPRGHAAEEQHERRPRTRAMQATAEGISPLVGRLEQQARDRADLLQRTPNDDRQDYSPYQHNIPPEVRDVDAQSTQSHLSQMQQLEHFIHEQTPPGTPGDDGIE